MLGTEFSAIKYEMPYSEPSSLLPTDSRWGQRSAPLRFGSEFSDIRELRKKMGHLAQKKMYYKKLTLSSLV